MNTATDTVEGLCEAWLNGYRSAVVSALGDLPPLQSAATALQIADLLPEGSRRDFVDRLIHAAW